MNDLTFEVHANNDFMDKEKFDLKSYRIGWRKTYKEAAEFLYCLAKVGIYFHFAITSRPREPEDFSY